MPQLFDRLANQQPITHPYRDVIAFGATNRNNRDGSEVVSNFSEFEDLILITCDHHLGRLFDEKPAGIRIGSIGRVRVKADICANPAGKGGFGKCNRQAAIRNIACAVEDPGIG